VRIRSSSRSIFQSRNFSSAFGAVFDLCFFAAAGLALGDSVPTRFLSALHRSRVSASQCPADFSSQGFLSFRTGVCFTDFRADFSRWRRDLSALSQFFISFWPGACARRCCQYSFRDFCSALADRFLLRSPVVLDSVLGAVCFYVTARHLNLRQVCHAFRSF
jgi:hypothetical protein